MVDNPTKACSQILEEITKKVLIAIRTRKKYGIYEVSITSNEVISK
jgi:hypothetical protein